MHLPFFRRWNEACRSEQSGRHRFVFGQLRAATANHSQRHDHTGREDDHDEHREHNGERALDECVANDLVHLIDILGRAARRLSGREGVLALVVQRPAVVPATSGSATTRR